MRSRPLILALLLATACAHEPAPQPTTRQDGEWIATYTQAQLREPTPHGELQVKADKLAFKGEPKFRRILMDDMSLVLRHHTQGDRLQVQAGHLFMVYPYQDIELSANVLITSPQGVELEADTIRWSRHTDTFDGTGMIRLLDEKYIIEADRIHASVNLTRYELFGLKGIVHLTPPEE